MKGYELRVRVCMLKDVPIRDINATIGKLINFSMTKNEELKELHNKVGFKGYCFSELIPYQKVFYKEEEVYDFYVRSLDIKIIENFRMELIDLQNEEMLVTDTEVKSTEHKNIIETVFTSTPTIITLMKNNKPTSWDKKDGKEVLENAVINNLCKKFNFINGTNIKVEKDDIIESLNIVSEYPIVVNYKSDKKGMLGYKLKIIFKENAIAQQMAHISYFLGLGTKNSSLGCGFVRVDYKEE